MTSRFITSLLKPANLLCLSLGFVWCIDASASKLKKREYARHKESMGVVLTDVNWGRWWGCAGLDNAQLMELKFENTNPDPEVGEKYQVIQLESPSRLFADPVFISYGFLVAPGTYALTGWNIKIAENSGKVGRRVASREQLVDGEEFLGGTFRVNAGEVIYIGDFYLDCHRTPIPWRYYVESGEPIEAHFRNYKSKFDFLTEKKILFRLLDTDAFGQDPFIWLNNDGNVAFAAGNYSEAIGYYSAVLDLAERAEDSMQSSLAMYGLGRANGKLCRYEEGVDWFEKSIAARESLPDAPGFYVSQNYLELARLHATKEDWHRVIVNYEMALPKLQEHGMPTTDPIGYADLLETLQRAYLETGNTGRSTELLGTAAQLRDSNEDKNAVFVADPYPTVCD